MKKLIMAIMSLSVGGLIYVLCRTDTLMMFTWFDRFYLTNFISSIRTDASALSTVMPTWVVYSLPNALWLFSGLLAFDIIWGPKASLAKLAWLSLFGTIAVGAEVCQALQLLPGIFDWGDMVLMIFSGFSALLLIISENKERKQEA